MPIPVGAIARGVSLASTAAAKISPEMIASAKSYVGKALGIAPASVNLGNIAAQSNAQASVVATALVRSGLRPDQIISAFDMRAVNDQDVREFIEYIRGVHAQAEGEVDKKAGHAYDVDRESARKVRVLKDDINWLMRQLGIQGVENLMRAKAVWENLNSNTFAVYAESQDSGSGY